MQCYCCRVSLLELESKDKTRNAASGTQPLPGPLPRFRLTLVGSQLLFIHRNEVQVIQVIFIAGVRDRGVGPVGHDCGCGGRCLPEPHIRSWAVCGPQGRHCLTHFCQSHCQSHPGSSAGLQTRGLLIIASLEGQGAVPVNSL